MAEGGFQVEALARLHYPNGVFIDARAGDYKASFSMTQQALEKEKCCYIRSLSREILNELFPPLKDEDHTLNVFFFYKDKEIKKFFNYAVKKYANAFEYGINNSALSTQSRVGLIKKPRSGFSYIGLQSTSTFKNTFAWLDVVALSEKLFEYEIIYQIVKK